MNLNTPCVFLFAQLDVDCLTCRHGANVLADTHVGSMTSQPSAELPSYESMIMSGIVPAAFTPVDAATRRPDPAKIDRLCAMFESQGVSAIFVCGTAGEFANMTLTERKTIAESWVRFKRSLRVIVHVGACCLSESVALALHAESIGADGIAAVPPFYFHDFAYSSAAHVAREVALIAKAVPSLPFWYYHIPMFTHVAGADSSISIVSLMEDLLQTPNCIGIKFTSDDLDALGRLHTLKKRTGKLNIMTGFDPLLYEFLQFDIDGAIGSGFNLIVREYRAGQLKQARALQDHANTILGGELHVNPLAVSKQMMKAITGVDAGCLMHPFEVLDEPIVASVADRILSDTVLRHYAPVE